MLVGVKVIFESLFILVFDMTNTTCFFFSAQERDNFQFSQSPDVSSHVGYQTEARRDRNSKIHLNCILANQCL